MKTFIFKISYVKDEDIVVEHRTVKAVNLLEAANKLRRIYTYILRLELITAK